MSQTVLVTGCSSGMGRAIALAFARRGDHVYATMRAPHRGADLQALIDTEGLDAQILELDVTSDASVRAAIGFISGRRGRVDVAVNNAGIGPFGVIEHTPDSGWLAALDTNLLGPVRVARAVLPGMRERGSGAIVNISSIAGRLASVPGQGAYAASKHALCAFTDSLVVECAPFGVRPYCIEPGFFATSIMDNATVGRLDDDDPYKPLIDGVEGFFRGGISGAPPPDAVCDVVLSAADGSLEVGHHPVGAPGFGMTRTAARTGG
jgi:NAD(P)-dependent dehydrogenase (short-subunit alcohol dehydrogenase family)